MSFHMFHERSDRGAASYLAGGKEFQRAGAQ